MQSPRLFQFHIVPDALLESVKTSIIPLFLSHPTFGGASPMLARRHTLHGKPRDCPDKSQAHDADAQILIFPLFVYTAHLLNFSENREKNIPLAMVRIEESSKMEDRSVDWWLAGWKRMLERNDEVGSGNGMKYG